MIPRRGRQRGIALIALLAVILLAASWMFLSRLNMSAAELMVQRRAHNAQVLNQAKQAVIGYMAQLASETGENNPGRLLCPESPSTAGTANEGIAQGNCSQPALGRLPWKTLGLDKLVDASGEPLWYVVSPGWALPSSSTYMTINSNTIGALSVDGNANAAIALIIAPGPAINAQAATGCTARDQLLTRTAPAPGINPLDYLECFSSSTYTYSTTGPGTSFNDQAVAVTTADLMPALEAAISYRIKRDVAPILKSLYQIDVPAWGLTSSMPVFPFATPFGDPSASNYQGVVGTREGLLPMSRSGACTGITVGCPPVNTTLTSWGSLSASSVPGGTLPYWFSNCSLLPSGAPTSIQCTVYTTSTSSGTVNVKLQATIGNPFVVLRAINATAVQNAPSQASSGASGFSPSCAWTSSWTSGETLGCTGSVSYPGCGFCFWQSKTVTVPIPAATTLLPDSALTDPNDGQVGWFVRNQWYQLAFYASNVNNLAGGTPPCSTNCLTVNNLSPSTGNRSLLILEGRALSGENRSTQPGLLSSYLENPENQNGDTIYVSGTPNLTLNDRFVIVDHN